MKVRLVLFKVFKRVSILLLLLLMFIQCEDVEAKSKPKYKTIVKTVTKKEYLGRFKITFYCPCYKCSGEHGGTTSTGKKAKEGRTIAVDKHVIPYGSKIKIGRKTYVAEDCGGAIKGKRIDIFLNSHNKCLKNGVKFKKVYIVKKIKKKYKIKIARGEYNKDYILC